MRNSPHVGISESAKLYTGHLHHTESEGRRKVAEETGANSFINNVQLKGLQPEWTVYEAHKEKITVLLGTVQERIEAEACSSSSECLIDQDLTLINI